MLVPSENYSRRLFRLLSKSISVTPTLPHPSAEPNSINAVPGYLAFFLLYPIRPNHFELSNYLCLSAALLGRGRALAVLLLLALADKGADINRLVLIVVDVDILDVLNRREVVVVSLLGRS